jgi:hypothetical protein
MHWSGDEIGVHPTKVAQVVDPDIGHAVRKSVQVSSDMLCPSAVCPDQGDRALFGSDGTTIQMVKVAAYPVICPVLFLYWGVIQGLYPVLKHRIFVLNYILIVSFICFKVGKCFALLFFLAYLGGISLGASHLNLFTESLFSVLLRLKY